MSRLTKKEKQFIQEYLVDLNATQAAIRAKYSPATARQIGAELMTKEKIRDAIDKAMAERSRRTGVSVDLVIRELARIARFDPRRMFNDDGSPKLITELDDDTAAALAGFEVMEIYEGRGDDRHFVGYLKKYKPADKKGALDSLAKHLGMFVERHEHSGPGGRPIQHEHKPDLSNLTDEELDALESIVRKTNNAADS